MLDEKQKRKREVEEKLQVLNQKKHNLVQVLKQVKCWLHNPSIVLVYVQVIFRRINIRGVDSWCFADLKCRGGIKETE